MTIYTKIKLYRNCKNNDFSIKDVWVCFTKTNTRKKINKLSLNDISLGHTNLKASGVNFDTTGCTKPYLLFAYYSL